MTKEEFKQMLKDNLSIKVECTSNSVETTVCFDGEEICSDYSFIPLF